MAGGKVLLLGVGLNSLTSFHIYEDLLTPSPWLPVYEEKPREFSMHGNGKQFVYRGFFHSAEFGRRRDVERLRAVFVATAGLRTIKTDFASLSILDAKGMTRTCLWELEQRRTGYSEFVPVVDRAAVRQALDALGPVEIEQ
jgi:aminoglycoside N3'-acetyltransferase